MVCYNVHYFVRIMPSVMMETQSSDIGLPKYKNIMKFIQCIGLVLILTSGCFNDGNNKKANSTLNIQIIKRDDFKDLGTVQGGFLKIGSAFNPSDVYFINNKLLLVDITNYQGMINIYDVKDTLESRSERIKSGNGPQELLDVWKIQQVSKDSLLFYSIYEGKLFPYNLKKDTIYSGIKLDVLTPGNPIAMDSFILITTMLEPPNINNFRFTRLNLNGEYNRSFGTLPLIDTTLSHDAYGEAFTVMHAFNPIAKQIVFGYIYTDVLEIYNNNGELKSRFYGPDHFTPKLRPSKRETGVSTYSMVVRPIIDETKYATKDIDQSTKYIYWLYDGRILFERGKQRSEQNDNCGTLFILNIDGEPLYQLRLDPPIFAFAVDSVKNVLYGLSSINDIELYRYSLSF